MSKEKSPAGSGAVKRTQVRFPEEVYFPVRHVAASMDISFNEALIVLLREALEAHHGKFPTL